MSEVRPWKGVWVLWGVAAAWGSLLVAASFRLAGDERLLKVIEDASEAYRIVLEYVQFGVRYDMVLFLSGGAVAALILRRDREHPFGRAIGVVFCLLPLTMTSWLMLSMFAIVGTLPEGAAPWLTQVFIFHILLLSAGIFVMIGLFPTGRFHSRRTRVTIVALSGAWAVAAMATWLRPGSPYFFGDNVFPFDNPFGVAALDGLDSTVLDVLFVALAVGVIGSLIFRYRASGSEQRHQLKWVLTAAAFMVVASAIPLSESEVAGIIQSVAGFVFLSAVGIAITKYRLYDIDIIINRALVFGGLAVVILAIYAPVVVGIGDAVGGDDAGLWLPIVSTTIVALVFEPARVRLQKWANRLVYGRRATPYEVLSDLTGRLAGAESDEGMLERMALRLAEGTGAERATVWLADETGFRAAASSPAVDDAAHVADLSVIDGEWVPIEHEGDTLGALSVVKRRGDAITPNERALLDDLAGSAALVIRRLRLDEALEQKAQELAESRLRLVNAQDVERRRLERDLHDGAQQQVVALKVKLGLAARIAEQDGSERTAELVGQLADEAQYAIEQIRALAQGIYPPLLESEGLRAAVPALAGLSPLDVEVDVCVPGRLPIALEGAVYFCVSEALTNAAKHGSGPVRVEIDDDQGRVTFSVADSGAGFDPATTERGAGLDNMADRLDAFGGALTITSEPGAGTTVSGWLPIEVPAAV